MNTTEQAQLLKDRIRAVAAFYRQMIDGKANADRVSDVESTVASLGARLALSNISQLKVDDDDKNVIIMPSSSSIIRGELQIVDTPSTSTVKRNLSSVLQFNNVPVSDEIFLFLFDVSVPSDYASRKNDSNPEATITNDFRHFGIWRVEPDDKKHFLAKDFGGVANMFTNTASEEVDMSGRRIVVLLAFDCNSRQVYLLDGAIEGLSVATKIPKPFQPNHTYWFSLPTDVPLADLTSEALSGSTILKTNKFYLWNEEGQTYHRIYYNRKYGTWIDGTIKNPLPVKLDAFKIYFFEINPLLRRSVSIYPTRNQLSESEKGVSVWTESNTLSYSNHTYRLTLNNNNNTWEFPPIVQDEIIQEDACFDFDIEVYVDKSAQLISWPLQAIFTQFDETKEYASGAFVWYRYQNTIGIYELPEGHEANVTWNNTTKQQRTETFFNWLSSPPDAADCAGKTVYIKCRLDCQTRTTTAKVVGVA